jgi:membrane protease subunit HflC
MNQQNFQQGAISSGLTSLIGGAVVLLIAIGTFLYFSLYTVREWEQAVVIQFGEVIGDPITDAGLHFKMPWQTVRSYDRRLQRWDGQQTTAITRDRRTVNIDVTARWRIVDAARFLEAIGEMRQADSRLNNIIDSAVRDEIAKYELFEVVRSSNRILEAEALDIGSDIYGDVADFNADELATLGAVLPRLRQGDDDAYRAGRPLVLQGILSDARRRLAQNNLGIELEDVLIKQLGYIREIESNVYAQMNAELQKIAAGFRSAGRERAEERLGEMQRELAIIESSAVERAQRIRGEAEADATRIYADAYNRAPELFAFLRGLEALQTTLGKNTTLVIGSDSPLFQLLRNPDGVLSE